VLLQFIEIMANDFLFSLFYNEEIINSFGSSIHLTLKNLSKYFILLRFLINHNEPITDEVFYY